MDLDPAHVQASLVMEVHFELDSQHVVVLELVVLLTELPHVHGHDQQVLPRLHLELVPRLLVDVRGPVEREEDPRRGQAHLAHARQPPRMDLLERLQHYRHLRRRSSSSSHLLDPIQRIHLPELLIIPTACSKLQKPQPNCKNGFAYM
jgi:hypothetical protein